MDTLLSQFCTEFDKHLRPLLQPLEEASQATRAAEQGMPGKALLPELIDLGLQFRALVDKVAEQQAYVLIFGPLKSGKSTLMNSVCAAYVSEVTSLPAYPCMVYVSHSESLHFIVTRYNGESQHFTDPTALRMEINRAHGELADRIRDVERRGEVFEPAVHFSKAIRRVDVKVPAGELEQSGAVLVDTPGLYARMKFGYDQMTRDFRNAAACAIFVVKSDNLFLEQVFSEFNQLLELFSRIFLVVNLDSGKRDLRPDGSLTPSLEREDPQRIIEAFQNLSMSAPLEAAMEEGRLRIYPVDLLQAASRRILAKRGGKATAERTGHAGEADFESFLGDLTDYLNSTEYLVAFLSDSLRRASTLLSETRSLLEHRAVEELRLRVRGLERDHELAKTRLEALGRLGDHDWRESFAVLQRDLETLTREWAREVEEVTTRRLDTELVHWFESDESVQDLITKRLRRVMVEHKRKLGERLWEALSERVGRGAAGVSLSAAVEEDLRTAEIHLDRLGTQSLLQPERSVLESGISAPFQLDDVPVRKALFWDWLTLRSRAVVRRRLFGPPERPTNPVPADVKQKRLGEQASEVLQSLIAAHGSRFFPDCVRSLCEEILGNYADTAAARVAEQLEREHGEQSRELGVLDDRLREHRRVLERLQVLEGQVESSSSAVETLSARYGGTEPIKLMQPYQAPEPAVDASSAATDEPPPQATPQEAAEPERAESE